MKAHPLSLPTLARLTLGGLLLAGNAAVLAASGDAVRVEFARPGALSDIGSRRDEADGTRDAYLSDLRSFIERKAGEQLGPDRRLDVTITDLDMAGTIEFGAARGRDIRLMRGSAPPRIGLRFRLTDTGGKVLSSGERRLTDLAYLTPERRTSDDPLFFEKRLIAEWLSTELRR